MPRQVSVGASGISTVSWRRKEWPGCHFILAEIGAERIIHSEDFPYVVRDNVSDFLEQADLTDEQRHAIAHRNAENVMGI